jgi:hypothetical protein
VCSLWLSTHRVVPFSQFGTLPSEKISAWVSYGCDFRARPYSSLVCGLIKSKFGSNTANWTVSATTGYVQVPQYVQDGYFTDCVKLPAIADPFYVAPATLNSPIYLTSSNLNISVSLVATASSSAPLMTDKWAPYQGILRIGNGSYVSPNVRSTASLVFAPKVVVQMTYAARWVLGTIDDQFTVSCSDLNGKYHLLKEEVLGFPVYGKNGASSIYTSYVFFPNPTGNFQINFGLTTSSYTAARKGVSVDYFVAKGF